MSTNSIKITLEKLAKQEGVTVEELRNEIELAIFMAQSTTDSKILEHWKQIPSKGQYPTPEELIEFLIEKLKN